MVCPIEQPLSTQLELFGDQGPQSEALAARSHDELLERSALIKTTCCRVGATNGFAPPVMCDGNVRGQIAIVGEALGRKERELGVPFVGSAGNVLRNMLIQAQIPDRAVYLVNILKCRPFDEIIDKLDPSHKSLKDRRPAEDEVAACFPLLQKQLSYAAAKYYVFLGATAAVACLGIKPSFKITDFTGYGIPLLLPSGVSAIGLVVPHPTYFLYNKSAEKQYAKTKDVFRDINNAILSRGAMSLPCQILPEELFLERKKPSYFEHKETATATP